MAGELNAAEQAFFSVLQGGTPIVKVGVDLSPNLVASLGGMPPEALDQLENAAANAPATSEDQEQGQPLEQPQADDSQSVGAFNRTDDEPPPDEEDLGSSPELPSRQTHGRLFTDKRAHPLQILDVLTMRYQTEWSEWEPETLWWALRRDFGPVGEIARNKIMALRVAVTTDMPWLDWDVFEDSGLAFNDIVPLINQLQPMLPMQMAFTVDILREIREDELFNNEVTAYIAAFLEEHGWVFAPEEFFGPAQTLLDRRVWLLGFKQQVQEVWEKVQNVDPSTIDWREDNAVDVHVLKLFVVKRYLQERAHLRVVVPGAPATASTVAPPVP